MCFRNVNTFWYLYGAMTCSGQKFNILRASTKKQKEDITLIIPDSIMIYFSCFSHCPLAIHIFLVPLNCPLVLFKSVSPSGDFCHLLLTFANKLDPDQAQQNMGSDLDPTV